MATYNQSKMISCIDKNEYCTILYLFDTVEWIFSLKKEKQNLRSDRILIIVIILQLDYHLTFSQFLNLND